MNHDNRNPYDKKTNVYIGKVRRDGKHRVTFCFYAKRIVKILYPHQFADYIASDGYNVIYS